MPTCFNCRQEVLAGSERCPYCGVLFVPATLLTALSWLSPRAAGWGISAGTRTSLPCRLAALLVPLWLPPLVVLLAGEQPGGSPVGLVLLLAPFAFIPGLHVLANVEAWSRVAKFAACAAYVGLASVGGFISMTASHALLYPR